jgi:predicted transcriptional regulator
LFIQPIIITILHNSLQQIHEKALLTFPLVLSKIKSIYDLSQTELIIILSINNANRIGSKVTKKDIRKIIDMNDVYVNTLVHELKKAGFITLNYDYKLTSEGKKVVRSYSYWVSYYIKYIENNTPLSFADYSKQSQRLANYRYKIKKGYIKEPGKKYKDLL